MLYNNPIYFEAISIKGSRSSNQDSFIIGSNKPSVGNINYVDGVQDGTEVPFIFVVADGVGATGGRAARAALSTVQRSILGYHNWRDYSDSFILKIIQESMDEANDAVLELSREANEYFASTVSLLLMINGQYYAANIGDSPIYHISERSVMPIFVKHTEDKYKLRRGEKPTAIDQDTLHFYLGHYAFSGSEMMEISSGTYNIGDSFLICSDGFLAIKNEHELSKTRISPSMPFLKTITETIDEMMLQDNCTAIRVSVNRIGTRIQLDQIERCESDSEYRREFLSTPSKYFENWEQSIATYYTDKKHLVKNLVQDWDISKRSANSWLKTRPTRDNVIRICLSIGLDLNQTNRVLAHDAHFGALEYGDSKDIIWIYMINSLNESKNQKRSLKEQKAIYEKQADHVPQPESKRRKLVIDRINRVLKENNMSVNLLWGESGHRQVKKSYEILSGKPKKGQFFPRYWLIAFSLKLGFTADSINELLMIAGMDPLRSKDIFEATIIYILTSLELSRPELFYDVKNMSMTGESGLVEAVIGRLTQFSNYLSGIYKTDFDISWKELRNYF